MFTNLITDLLGISTPGIFRLYLDDIYFRMNFHRYDYQEQTIISSIYHIPSLSSLHRKTNDLRLSFVWLEETATHSLAQN